MTGYAVTKTRWPSNGYIYDIARPSGEPAGAVIRRHDLTIDYITQQGAELPADLRPAYDAAVQAHNQVARD